MTIVESELEESLKRLLQSQVCIYMKNTLLRKGKLVLFKQNGFYIELFIKKGDILKKLELPIPFKIEEWKDDGILYFDYRLSAIIEGDSIIEDYCSQLNFDNANKFFNTIVEISTKE